MPCKQPVTPVDVLQSALTYLLSRHSMIISQQDKGCAACSALTITQHLQLLLDHPNLPSGALKAVTTPRGNRITFWDTHTYSYRYSAEIPEVSGIQFLPEHDAFLVSNAQGKLYTVKAGYSQAHVKLLAGFDDTQWDNHLFLG